MSDRELQRWIRDVAEDPGAPSFVLLARAYRREGRRADARDVARRGLERNPGHIKARALLALLCMEDGDRDGARDEWETLLVLAPGDCAASLGLGCLALERGDLDAARRHLEEAARAKPHEPIVAKAQLVLQRRLRERPAPAGNAGGTAQAEPEPSGNGHDPSLLFDALAEEAAFRGALVLDENGLVLAGSLADSPSASGELLGTLLATVVEEAHRTADLIRLGGWEGLLIDCEQATLHLTPLPRGAVVVVVAPPRTPAGWVTRVATRAAELGRRFMEVQP